MNDNTTIKREAQRPEDPVILRGPNAGNGEVIELDSPNTLKLQAFPDGAVFKYCPHPSEEGTFAIFGPDLKPVAFLENPALARLFCDSVRMVFAAAEQFKTAKPAEHCAATRGATEGN